METVTNPFIFERHVVSMANVLNSLFSGLGKSLFKATFLLLSQTYSAPMNLTSYWLILLASTSVPCSTENGVKHQHVFTLHSKWVLFGLIMKDIINILARHPFHPLLISAGLDKTSPAFHLDDPTVQISESSSSTAILTSLVVLACIIVVTVLTLYIIKKRRLLSFSTSFRRRR